MQCSKDRRLEMKGCLEKLSTPPMGASRTSQLKNWTAQRSSKRTRGTCGRKKVGKACEGSSAMAGVGHSALGFCDGGQAESSLVEEAGREQVIK